MNCAVCMLLNMAPYNSPIVVVNGNSICMQHLHRWIGLQCPSILEFVKQLKVLPHVDF